MPPNWTKLFGKRSIPTGIALLLKARRSDRKFAKNRSPHFPEAKLLLFSRTCYFLLDLTKEQIVRVRIGQQFFREAVLTAYNRRCCVTGIAHDALLVASHIKPWKDSDPKTERANPRNGLCLSPLYDKAFDAGLMTIDDKYQINFSSLILRSTNEEAAAKFFHCYQGKELTLPDRFTPEQHFFDHHRNHIFIP